MHECLGWSSVTPEGFEPRHRNKTLERDGLER
jgi:hypothetical protein